MSILTDLNDAKNRARDERELYFLTQYQDEIFKAATKVAEDISAENMRNLNGLWATAVRFMKALEKRQR